MCACDSIVSRMRKPMCGNALTDYNELAEISWRDDGCRACVLVGAVLQALSWFQPESGMAGYCAAVRHHVVMAWHEQPFSRRSVQVGVSWTAKMTGEC